MFAKQSVLRISVWSINSAGLTSTEHSQKQIHRRKKHDALRISYVEGACIVSLCQAVKLQHLRCRGRQLLLCRHLLLTDLWVLLQCKGLLQDFCATMMVVVPWGFACTMQLSINQEWNSSSGKGCSVVIRQPVWLTLVFFRKHL